MKLRILSAAWSTLLTIAIYSNVYAQVPVTFNVNMGVVGISNELHIAGNFQDPNYDNVPENPSYENWTPNSNFGLMTDDDMDFIYSVTLLLVPGRYEFKFINGSDWQFAETVPSTCTVEVNGNNNRQIMVGTEATSYSVCYGECADCGENAIRMRVDMSTVDLDADGVFAELGEDISPLGVHVNGSFVNWTTFVTLQDWDNNNIWETTITTASADPIQYKFINGNDWATPELIENVGAPCGVDQNRLLTITDQNTVLPILCWNSCGPCTQPVAVTFQVDLNASCVDTSPGLNLMGTLTNWSDGAPMSDDDGDGIWTVTLYLNAGNYEYKYRIGDSGWEGISNRQLTVVADNPQQLSVVCFDSNQACEPVVPPANITFNLTPGSYTIPAGQSVWVMGDFTTPNWQDGALQMNDNNGDGIWSVTVPQVCPASIFYKFTIGNPSSGNYVQEEADFSAIGGCGLDNGTFSDNRFLTRSSSAPISVCHYFNSCQICALQNIPGCLDPTACNYNPAATVSDGSCNYDCPPCDSGNGINLIWSDDFSNPQNWIIAHDGTFNSDFEIGIGLESTGPYGTPAIQSTTAGNGYAIYNSDSYNNSAGIAYEQPHLTTAFPIDLSGFENVILQFETQYRSYNDEQTWLIVSTDGTFPVLDDPMMDISSLPGVFRVWEDGELTQSVSPGNPTTRSFNISDIAGGASQVWIRFQYTGIWGYAWYIDDVQIRQQFDYDAQLTSARLEYPTTGIEYGRIPLSQLPDNFTLNCNIQNAGSLPLQNLTLSASIVETNSNTILFNDNVAFYPTLASGQSINLVEDIALYSTPLGNYTVNFNLSSAEQTCDGNTANNAITKNIRCTSDLFAVDSDELYPASETISGSLGTNSFTDNSDEIMLMNLYSINTNSMVSGIEILLAEGTIAGGDIIVSIHDSLDIYSNVIDNYYALSDFYTLTEIDVANGYVYIPFTSPIMLSANGYYAAITLFSYGDMNRIRISDSYTVAQPTTASMIYLPSDGVVYSNGNAFGIRMKFGNSSQIAGCTSPNACNYNPQATTNNGSCLFTGSICNDGNANTLYDSIDDNCNCTGFNVLPNCADEIFISEYVEGTNNNKAIELYNPSSNPILLDGVYSMGRDPNGSGIPQLLDITGVIQPHGVRVFALDKRDPNGIGIELPISPLLEAVADTFLNPVYVQSNSPMYFNGDDAFVLVKNGNVIIDLLGKIGEDPGSGWWQPGDPTTRWWTVDNSMVRKPEIIQGVTSNPEVFDPSIEWDTLMVDDFSHLGWHESICVQNVAGCTAPNACNYNPIATIENGSCLYAGTACDDGNPSTTNDIIQGNCTCFGTLISTNCNASDYEFGGVEFGIYPDTNTTLVNGCVNEPYYQPFYINVPTDGAAIDPGLAGITISNMVINGMTIGQNPISDYGLTLTCNNNDCVFAAGQQYCMNLFGVPNQSGTFNITLNATMTVNFTGFPIEVPLSFSNYTLIISANCSSPIAGCTNPSACNYNPAATINDGSCLIIGTSCNDSNPSTINDIVQNNCECAGTPIDPGCTGFTVSNETSNPTCAGLSNGFISINASGTSAPFNYAWSNGATTSAINNIGPGGYSVNITDALGCTETLNFTINSPTALNAITTSGSVSCSGASTGSAAVNVTGGTAPYVYAWNTSPIQNTAQISNVAAGNYTVTITDANGCVLTSNVSITQPDISLSVVATPTAAACSQSDGSASAIVTGNTGAIQYLWSNGQTGATATNLAAGAYTVTVTSGGCTAETTVNVNNLNAPVINQASSSPACFGASSGTINTIVTGGTQPYQYLWSNGGSGTSQSGLTAGNYTFIVIDNAGCQSSIIVTLTQPNPISISLATSPTSCSGAPQGSVNATVSGGTEPYQYSWSNGSAGTVINNLSAGQYSLDILDANGCSANASAQVISPDGVIAFANSSDVNCIGGNDGSMEIIVTEGNPPYTYEWSNGVSGTSSINNLTSGDYSCTITDATGCTFNVSELIGEPEGNLPEILGFGVVDPFSIQTYSTSPIDGASFTWQVIGGNILSGQGSNFIQVQWSDDAPASIELIITNPNGCESTLTLAIQIGTYVSEIQPTISWSIFPNPTTTNIQLMLKGTNEKIPFRILDMNGREIKSEFMHEGLNTIDLSNLAAGIYSIELMTGDNRVERQRLIKH
jgi:hypothetical protein